MNQQLICLDHLTNHLHWETCPNCYQEEKFQEELQEELERMELTYDERVEEIESEREEYLSVAADYVQGIRTRCDNLVSRFPCIENHL